jgi:hypothetical protein
MKKLLQKIRLNWKYRQIDHDVCCCGEQIGKGGSICLHGGCRSAREYLMSKQQEKGER